MDIEKEGDWDIVIRPKERGFNLKLREVWAYRDLLYMYVKRDFSATYTQTILGPAWFFIQPVFTTLIFLVVFTGIAQIPTDGLPPMLFYMAGNVLWAYFSECLNKSSSTFSANVGVFSKVYFPRLVVPISSLVSSSIRLGIQLLMFFGFYVFFYLSGSSIQPNAYALLLPLLICMIAGLGFGFGSIISSMTIKYRDLSILFSFTVGLLMYITPIIYPLSAIPDRYKSYTWIIQLNPLSSIVETFRYGFLGEGSFSWWGLAYSFVFTIIITIIGILIFNKVERRFVDII
jgi:lipopolysaccharide transport system permease protein